MGVHEFIVALHGNYGVVKGSRQQRRGQWYMNQLYGVRPDLARQLRGDMEHDPFYDDKKIPCFVKWLYENWS